MLHTPLPTHPAQRKWPFLPHVSDAPSPAANSPTPSHLAGLPVSDDIPNMPLLGPDNWFTWRRHMKLVLTSHDLWSVVGEDPPPPPPAGIDTVEDTVDGAATAAALAAHADACVDFTRRTTRAKALMVRHVSDMYLSVVHYASTAKDAWAALTARHSPMEPWLMLDLQREMCSLKQGDSESAAQYFARARNLRARLRNAEVEMRETVVVAAVILGVDWRFNDAVNAFFGTTTRDEWNLDDLGRRLMLWEEMDIGRRRARRRAGRRRR